jgi:signal peptidase II
LFTKNARKIWLYSLALIASGGIGNMIERVSLGYVTDFIDFTLINFAVFNVADSFVCVGAFFLLLDLIVDLIKDPTGEKSKSTRITEEKESE